MYNHTKTTTRPSNTTPNANVPAWSTISGRMTLFGNVRKGARGSFITYQTSVSSRADDGSYNRYYFDVLFAKGIEPDVDGRIDLVVDEGFLTFRSYTDKDGNEHTRPAVMILKAHA